MVRVFTRKKLMAAAAREKAERMLLLGDLLYHGARNDLPKGYAPKEVIALLTNAPCPISAVRGNCDSEVDQMVLAFPIMRIMPHDGRGTDLFCDPWPSL